MIALCCGTLFAASVVATRSAHGANHYVDKDATGTNDGSSWADAWTSIPTSVAVWANIHGGDTIYVSGGSSSKTYDKVRLSGIGVTDGEVTITKGLEAGHDGEVIFSATNASWPNASFYLDGAAGTTQNVRLSGFTFRWDLDAATGAAVAVGNGADHCTLENSHVVSAGYGHAIGVNTASNLTIRANVIETLANTHSVEQDGIILGHASGDIVIEENVIVLRGNHAASDPNAPHMDGIQFYYVSEAPDLGQVVIRGNFITSIQEAGSRPAAGIYAYNVNGDWQVYNNVLSIGEAHDGWVSAIGINAGDYSALAMGVEVYNNTIITHSYQNYPISVDYGDAVKVKNNVIHCLGLGDGYAMSITNSVFDAVDVDYNQVFKASGSGENDIRATTTETFADWQAAGYEAHGHFVAATFADIDGTDVEDYRLLDGSRGIDEGTALDLFANDIDNVARPQGGLWDRGAFEFRLAGAGGAAGGAAAGGAEPGGACGSSGSHTGGSGTGGAVAAGGGGTQPGPPGVQPTGDGGCGCAVFGRARLQATTFGAAVGGLGLALLGFRRRPVGRLFRLLSTLLVLLASGCASLTIRIPPHVTLRAGAYTEIVGSITNESTPVGGVDVVDGRLPPGLSLDFQREETRFVIRGVPSEPGRYEVGISAWTYGTNFPGKRATARLSIFVVR
jgi:hypothetical protein